MEKINYPSPCLKCRLQDKCTRRHAEKAGCSEYQKWFMWWWKHFRVTLPQEKVNFVEKQKFVYEHPDLMRDFSKEKPCNSCKSMDCDVPCVLYRNWFSLAWEISRRRVKV